MLSRGAPHPIFRGKLSPFQVITIIKKTIDEIKKAEKQAAKILADSEKQKEHIMTRAREQVQQMTDRQKNDIAGLRDSKIGQARTKAEHDASQLLDKEMARIQDKSKKMEKDLPKAVDLIIKEFKQVVN